MEQLSLRAAEYFRHLQEEICTRLELVDTKRSFHRDAWKHHETGGGITCVMEDGKVFEKAGVNYSSVESKLSEVLALRMKTTPQSIRATGISLVLHPCSPMVPTVHMNLRYLELENGDAWFGGGTDLTPCYIVEEDARHFHQTLKETCDRHDPAWYPRFKQWCDEYFFLAHRGEARGIGGIFFDYQRERLEDVFAFVRDLGSAFLPAYLPIVERRKNEPWGAGEKLWQLLRRGRYVEFNLICDRGTLFGLETKGRTESILMSLPPTVRWQYDYQPERNSREAALLEVLRTPKGWT